MTNDKIKNEIREICAYHSNGGTNGYFLDEDRFTEIFDLIDKQEENFKKIISKILEKDKSEQSGITLEKKLDELIKEL